MTGFMAHIYFTTVIFLHLWLSISWWPAGDYWVPLRYTWDLIPTIKVEEYNTILNILKKIVLAISHLSPKIERYIYTNLFWLYLWFLTDNVVKTYFMKALIENNGFCKEGKHDSLGCDDSGKELLKKKNCSLYERYQFCILNEAELGCRKKATCHLII